MPTDASMLAAPVDDDSEVELGVPPMKPETRRRSGSGADLNGALRVLATVVVPRGTIDYEQKLEDVLAGDQPGNCRA